ncbi:Transposon TX1 uncharacterized protein [Merluccius polli]|uniref:Transposon TX1 uncharacterized protein n=1 Tax=Merluccius polli TaxID=89951 RepID=A0AA47P1Y4_MERPO|nr:Transposon TX1 uncharacterized protein [Merluccius polli]
MGQSWTVQDGLRGVTTLAQVVEVAGPQLQGSVGLASKLGLRSSRVAKKLLDHWKKRLSRHELQMLDTFSSGETTANTQDSFPLIELTVDLKVCAGLHLDRCPQASLQEASGKAFYHLMVKTLNRDKLNGRIDTPWRSHFDLRGSGPAWRSLYKQPLTKRHGDLQWRILHGAVAVNAFICVVNVEVEDRCPFCTERETSVFTVFTEVFTKEVFICGFKYTRQKKEKSQLLNFVLGQAKMAVYVSRKRRVDGGETISPVHEPEKPTPPPYAPPGNDCTPEAAPHPSPHSSTLSNTTSLRVGIHPEKLEG